jgi:hypothetical protein
MGLKLYGKHQLLAFADDMNQVGDYILTINKDAGTSIDVNKEAGLEINEDKIEYMLSPEFRTKSGHKNRKQVCCKCVTIKVFANKSNKSKF